MNCRLTWITFFLFLLAPFIFSQVNNQEFASRREALMHKLNDGVVVLRGAQLQSRNKDVDYKFRQNSDFYYLSGFDEPGATMLLVPEGDGKFILFVKPNDPHIAVWVGESYGVNGAMDLFKADTAYSNQAFEETVKKYLKNQQKIYLPFDDSELLETVSAIIKSPRANYPKKMEDISKHIAGLRLIKSSYEIEMMQKSIDITVEAHKEAMRAMKPGLFEYEIEALIKYVYLINGSPRVGFSSIVGSGPNSTILHYKDNNQKMKNGEIVVIDIGAEYGMYSADITRTIPANGKFSEEQKEIYQIVLGAQNAGIELAKPGVGISEIYSKSVDIVREGLLSLGLITDKEKHWQTRVWFMHGVGHWLGLDTHDAGSYRGEDDRGRLLEKGMVFTVEPGIYIAPKALQNLKMILGDKVSLEEINTFIEAVTPAYEKYKNIGVRVEDDILVTKTGFRNLSKGAPREIAEIEILMAKESLLIKK